MNHEDLVAKDDTRVLCTDVKGYRISTIGISDNPLFRFETASYPKHDPDSILTRLRVIDRSAALINHREVVEDIEENAPEIMQCSK